MSNIYDELYQDSDYYGNPLPHVLDYLKCFQHDSKLLDVGCGQGRYAIPLAEMGFRVTAVDKSELAINQLQDKISKTQLNIQARLYDAYLFNDYPGFDIIFFNLFFHFNPHELTREMSLLKRIGTEMKVGSHLVIVGYRDLSDMELIKSILIGLNSYRVLTEKTFHHSNTALLEQEHPYFILSFQKHDQGP